MQQIEPNDYMLFYRKLKNLFTITPQISFYTNIIIYTKFLTYWTHLVE